jgi:transcriptional regulator NrdR family protein
MTVLVERLEEHRYRASTGQPVAMASEGSSREEAVERLREQATQRLKGGELVEISIAAVADANPWVRYAGIWKNHPDFDAFLENLAEYRRTANEADLSP